jgi:hypothetical protein
MNFAGPTTESPWSLTSPRICVAILLGAPFNAQNLERTGIPYLSPYANIVVLDCKPWLGRSDAGLHHAHAQWEPVEKIGSARDLEQALRRHRPDYALDFIGLGALTPKLQELLAGAGTRFVVQKSGSLPVPSPWSRLAWKLRSSSTSNAATTDDVASSGNSAMAGGSLSRLLNNVRARWLLRRSLRAPDLALLAGSASLNHFTRRARHILWVASQDYHIYRRLQPRAQEGLLGGRYAVFVDDNLPFASDWTLLGLPAPVTPQRYYPAMQRVLEALERLWGMPIVVAPHPSSRHDPRVQQGFGARQLVHGRTAELVRDAQAVILHGSTAVSFAVLARKPMLFLTSAELAKSANGLHVRTMAAALGRSPLDIDREDDLPTLHSLAPDPRKLQRYVEQYLCSRESSETQPWQAFIDYLRGQVSTHSRTRAGQDQT